MKKTLLSILLLLLLANAEAKDKVIFYLHGRIVEEMGPEAVETARGFGAYEYYKILETFRKEHFIVISECRPKGTDPRQYAKKVARQVDSLLEHGYQPGEITIIGASKGSLIAQYASGLISNPVINCVFMAGCSEGGSPDIEFCGNILSIYEASDDIAGSCETQKRRSQKKIPHYKELKINTGLKHGFLYRPLPEWIKPALQWANGHYN